MNKDFAPIIEKVKKANSIVLLVHENPDGDAIGSMIALKLALKKFGKNVSAFIEKRPANCMFLLENRNDIKNFEDINSADRYDLCMVLDCGDLKRIGDAAILFSNAEDTACLDHHLTNSSFTNADYVDSTAAATGEIVYDFINELGVTLDMEIATAIYSAIVSDTGNFKHSNTNRRTFEIASELIEYGPDISLISYHMFSETSLNRLKMMGRMLANIEMELDDKIGILSATNEDMEEYNLEENDLDGIVDFARYVKGTEVGILIKQNGDFFKVSMRSNGKVDVADIAKRFDGGGHKFASGCRVYTQSADEVKNSLLEELKKVLPISLYR